MSDFFQGRVVKIRANDFLIQDISARVVLADKVEGKILLELGVALQVAGVLYRYAIASPRLERDNLVDLLNIGVLRSAVIWVPATKFDTNKPLDVSWWRGGAASLTDIYLDSVF